jgi:hypothetical protein
MRAASAVNMFATSAENVTVTTAMSSASVWKGTAAAKVVMSAASMSAMNAANVILMKAMSTTNALKGTTAEDKKTALTADEIYDTGNLNAGVFCASPRIERGWLSCCIAHFGLLRS